MFIYSCVIIVSALILYVGFGNAVCQFVETDFKYFRVGRKGSSTKELIHDGRTGEGKWSSLHSSGRQSTRRGNKVEGFSYGRCCEIIEKVVAGG